MLEELIDGQDVLFIHPGGSEKIWNLEFWNAINLCMHVTWPLPHEVFGANDYKTIRKTFTGLLVAVYNQ